MDLRSPLRHSDSDEVLNVAIRSAVMRKRRGHDLIVDQRDMAMPMSGGADKDFVMMMLPHHQGAIDMAKVELQYGKDPAMKTFAQGIVDAQERKIAEMKTWQAENAI